MARPDEAAGCNLMQSDPSAPTIHLRSRQQPRNNNNNNDEEAARKPPPSQTHPNHHHGILPPHLRLAPRVDAWFAFAVPYRATRPWCPIVMALGASLSGGGRTRTTPAPSTAGKPLAAAATCVAVAAAGSKRKRPPETFRADKGMKGNAGSDDDGEGGDASDPATTRVGISNVLQGLLPGSAHGALTLTLLPQLPGPLLLAGDALLSHVVSLVVLCRRSWVRMCPLVRGRDRDETLTTYAFQTIAATPASVPTHSTPASASSRGRSSLTKPCRRSSTRSSPG